CLVKSAISNVIPFFKIVQEAKCLLLHIIRKTPLYDRLWSSKTKSGGFESGL
ncbi:unnamed protein product, partial [Brassica oleracea var. botrytis]